MTSKIKQIEALLMAVAISLQEIKSDYNLGCRACRDRGLLNRAFRKRKNGGKLIVVQFGQNADYLKNKLWFAGGNFFII